MKPNATSRGDIKHRHRHRKPGWLPSSENGLQSIATYHISQAKKPSSRSQPITFAVQLIRIIGTTLLLASLHVSGAYKGSATSGGNERMVRLCIASVDPVKLTSQCVMCNRREFPLTVIDCTGITKVNDLIANPLSVQEATCLIYNCRRQVPDVKPEPYHGSVSHAVNYRGAASNYHPSGLGASPVSGSSIYEMMTPSGIFGGGYPVYPSTQSQQTPVSAPPPYMTRFGSVFGSANPYQESYAPYSASVPRGLIGGPNIGHGNHQALPYALVPAPRTFPFDLLQEHSAMSSYRKPKTINPDEIDPSVYYYDEVYEDMRHVQDVEEESGKQSKKKQGSKYIQGIIETAERRKSEKEVRKFKKYARDREEAQASGNLNDEEVYVTKSYKKKLDEMSESLKRHSKSDDERALNSFKRVKSSSSDDKGSHSRNQSTSSSANLSRSGHRDDPETCSSRSHSQSAKHEEHSSLKTVVQPKRPKTIEERREYLRKILSKRTVGDTLIAAQERYRRRKAEQSAA